MRRRTVLRLLSSALIPGALGRVAAWPAPPTRGRARRPSGSRPSRRRAPARPGVSATDVRVGMSAAFKGTAAGLGTEFYRGAQAYYEEINARGGVHGRTITVVGLDDNYEPLPCVKNTIQLLEKEHVFFLSNYVGTPTLTRALPVIKRYSDQQVLLVGNFTGAQPQREAPYVEHVFNVRASYRQEMAALVERFWGIGARTFGVYSQADAYGRSGTDGVARALAARGARVAVETTYRARRQVRGRHGPGGQRAAPGRRGRRALHRRLPGLRRLRAHRPRPRLDGADLQRLVRGLRRHAPAAGPARQDHRPRLHARPGELAGRAELRRRQPARRRWSTAR